MSDKVNQIADLLAPTVHAMGLELLGVEYLPAPGGATLRLYIDVIEAERETRTVNIDDCEAVSREVSAQMDVEDPISGNYTLEVSSPGVERPLFTAAQFARFAGERVKIVLKLAQNGYRRVQGVIVRVEGEQLMLEENAEQFVIDLDNVEKARLVPDWVALGIAPQPKKKPARRPTGQSRENKPNPNDGEEAVRGANK